MAKHDIHHQVGIRTSAQAVFEALTVPKKLAAWWTSDTRGSGSKVGDVLEFLLGDFCQKFEVIEVDPGKSVAWRGSREGMDGWAGTVVRFTLTPDENQCWVRFTHSGWAEADDFFSHCSTKWAVFMLSLKDLLEKGKGRPAPGDVPINHD